MMFLAPTIIVLTSPFIHRVGDHRAKVHTSINSFKSSEMIFAVCGVRSHADMTPYAELVPEEKFQFEFRVLRFSIVKVQSQELQSNAALRKTI